VSEYYHMRTRIISTLLICLVAPSQSHPATEDSNWPQFRGPNAAGALQGSIAGAISSAVYGQDIWKGMGYGALGGVIGAGVAISTATVLSFGKSVIDELMPSVVESIGKLALAIGRAAIKVASIATNIAVVTAKLAVRLTIFPFQAAGALIGDIIYGPLEEGIAGMEDRVTGRLYCMLVKSFRFNTIIGYNWTPFAGETHLSAVEFSYAKAGSLGTLRHECGHGLQAWLSGPLYYITVVPLTFPSNILKHNLGIYKSPIHIFEDDATNRARILFFGQLSSGD